MLRPLPSRKKHRALLKKSKRMNNELIAKYEKLKKYIASFKSVAVAYSSGVDSTFLLYAAKEALGDKAIALTATAASFPKRELCEAKEFCEKIGVKQFVIDFDEFKVEGFCENPKNRCYLCKRELFTLMGKVALENGAKEILEGSNLDDEGDYRPGMMAIKELGIKSPLRELGFTKAEIRELSKEFNLPTWQKPSFACLASRFPYGETISKEKLEMVEKAEEYLLDMGFKQVRVRIHSDVARIELDPSQFDLMMKEETRTAVYKKLKEFGFSYVSLDLLGYRTGSMNETITG